MAQWYKDDSDLENGFRSAPSFEPTYEHQPSIDNGEHDYYQAPSRRAAKKKRGTGKWVGMMLAVALAAGAAGGGAGAYVGYRLGGAQQPTQSRFALSEPALQDVTATPQPEVTVPVQNAASSTKTVLTTPQIAKKVLPSVVGIKAKTDVQTPFGTTTQGGSGSGVIISEDGYIMTNNHVVSGASNLQVVMDNGDTYDAMLIGTDAKTDLAVIKVQATGLAAATLGKSSELNIGEMAVAIGNPLGDLYGSVTQGIISAVNRTITIDGQSMTLLQTDAAINPGNSGGALVNQYGEIIGVNSAKSTGVDVEGIGFAIPIDDAKPIIEDLINNGYVTGRPKMGIYISDVTQQDSEKYNLPIGVYVGRIEAGSAAEAAGMQPGDVIVKADGKEVTTGEALTTAVKTKAAGDQLELTVIRSGEQVVLTLTLQEDAPQNITNTRTGVNN